MIKSALNKMAVQAKKCDAGTGLGQVAGNSDEFGITK